MAEMKTKRNEASVDAFLAEVADPKQREDSLRVKEIMEEITGEAPKMWGGSIVGFGSYHYKYKSGHEGDWFLTGFSPRKGNLTLYIVPGFESYGRLMSELGTYKTGKSCLYVKKLEDVDLPTLKKLIKESVAHMEKLVEEGGLG